MVSPTLEEDLPFSVKSVNSIDTPTFPLMSSNSVKLAVKIDDCMYVLLLRLLLIPDSLRVSLLSELDSL